MSDFISQDLLLPILKLLPVETLLRFRCVCKSWKELIDSKSFILSHLSLQSPGLIVQNQEFKYLVCDPQTLPSFVELGGPYKIQIEDTDSDDSEIRHSYYLYVVSTIHGVVCLYDHGDTLLLWNPSIRRLLKLPLPQISPSLPDLFPLDPLDDDFRCCGLWIDPSVNDFKVVVFFLVKGVIALYSSRKQAWIEFVFESERLQDDCWQWSRSPMILIEGMGYWRLYDRYFDEPDVIVSFDFGQDKFGGTIELPKLEQLDDLDYNRCFVKWRDCAAIVHFQQAFPCGCDLWAMQNGSWSKMFSINLFEDVDRVLYLAEDCDVVLVHPCQGPLELYDREDGSSIVLESDIIGFEHVICAYDFVESLVIPGQ